MSEKIASEVQTLLSLKLNNEIPTLHQMLKSADIIKVGILLVDGPLFCLDSENNEVARLDFEGVHFYIHDAWEDIDGEMHVTVYPNLDMAEEDASKVKIELCMLRPMTLADVRKD